MFIYKLASLSRFFIEYGFVFYLTGLPFSRLLVIFLIRFAFYIITPLFLVLRLGDILIEANLIAAFNLFTPFYNFINAGVVIKSIFSNISFSVSVIYCSFYGIYGN